jgi:sugar phosphate isomerase/epimerase
MKYICLSFTCFFSLISMAQTAIGVQLYSFRNQFPGNIPAVLSSISKMGIREIEGGETYGMPRDEFIPLLKANNLEMVSIGAAFEKLQNELPAVIADAKAYGARYVVCFWIPHEESGFTVADADKAISVFNTAGKILKANGLSLCYHPHGYEFGAYGKGTLFDYLMKSMDPQFVNFEMDVYWIKHPGQDPVALLKKYRNRFLLMHLKDRKPGTTGNQQGRSDVETNVVLGTGDVGITAIMKVAKKYGVKHFFIEDESSRSMEQVPQSLAFLKQF